MIKINLLGEVETVESSGTSVAYAYVASLLALCVLFYFLYSSVSEDIASFTRKKDDLESQLAQLELVTKEVREYELKKKDLDDKLSIIATLRLSQKGPVRVLDDINNAAPPTLWLTEMKETKGVLEVSGVAIDNGPIVELMKNLERSEFFRSVDLVESSQVFLVRKVEQQNGNSGGRQSPGRGGSNQAAASSSGTRVVYELSKYEGLSREQREGFDKELFGYGQKVRAFTIKLRLNYAGRHLKAVEAVTAATSLGTPIAAATAAPQAKTTGEE